VVVGVEFAGTGGRGLSGVAVETFAECAKEWLIVVCIYLLMFTVCCLLRLPSIHSHRFMLLLFCCRQSWWWMPLPLLPWLLLYFYCSRVVPNCVISWWWLELNYQVCTLLVVGGGLFGDNDTLVFTNAAWWSRGIVWCGCGNNGRVCRVVDCCLHW